MERIIKLLDFLDIKPEKELKGKYYKVRMNNGEYNIYSLEGICKLLKSDYNLIFAFASLIGDKTGWTLVIEYSESYWVCMGEYLECDNGQGYEQPDYLGEQVLNFVEHYKEKSS